MASRTIAALMVLAACRSGEHSATERSSKRHDAGTLRKVALARPDDDTASFAGGPFRGRDRNCKLGTVTRLYPGEDFPDRVALSVEAFAIDRRTVSCFDFDRCIESGRCTGDTRLTKPTVSVINYCSDGVAIVSHDAAEEYCKWREMSLPTLAQWQRAIRGAEGWTTPGGNTVDLSLLNKRELASPDGVIYSTELVPTNAEWLRDRDCVWMTKGGGDETLKVQAMFLDDRRLYDFGYTAVARVRCVREPHAGRVQSDAGAH